MNIRDVILGIISAVVILAIVQALVGITMAIALPEWLRFGNDVLKLHLWNFFIVDFPAVMIPAFLVTYFACRFRYKSIVVICVSIICLYHTVMYAELFTLSTSIGELINMNGYRVIMPNIHLLIAVTLSGLTASIRLRHLIREFT